MIRTIFKVFFKVLLALGAIFAVVSVLKYLEDQQADYIQIYDDDNGMEGEYY